MPSASLYLKEYASVFCTCSNHAICSFRLSGANNGLLFQVTKQSSRAQIKSRAETIRGKGVDCRLAIALNTSVGRISDGWVNRMKSVAIWFNAKSAERIKQRYKPDFDLFLNNANPARKANRIALRKIA